MPGEKKNNEKDEIEKVMEEVIHPKPRDTDIDREKQTKVMLCAVDCSNARNICLESVNYCLSKFGDKASNFAQPLLIKSLQDAAELCDITISFLLRGSPIVGDILQACIKACDLAVEECKRRGEDKQMKDTIKYLRLCSDACKELVK